MKINFQRGKKRTENYKLSCFLQNISDSIFSKWILEDKNTFSRQLFISGDLINFPITDCSKVKPTQAGGERIHLAATENTKHADFWVSSLAAGLSAAQDGQ